MILLSLVDASKIQSICYKQTKPSDSTSLLLVNSQRQVLHINTHFTTQQVACTNYWCESLLPSFFYDFVPQVLYGLIVILSPLFPPYSVFFSQPHSHQLKSISRPSGPVTAKRKLWSTLMSSLFMELIPTVPLNKQEGDRGGGGVQMLTQQAAPHSLPGSKHKGFIWTDLVNKNTRTCLQSVQSGLCPS